MTDTKIEWADKAWNPVTGCTKVSQGCRNCYAERIASRFWGERKFGEVVCHDDRLDIPLHWKKPQRIFVNSMSDLFHPDVPSEFIGDVWWTMQRASWHTYLILTKRPERMYEFVTWLVDDEPTTIRENIWIGVSVEDQKIADERIPWLLRTPAAVRFVSYEPALGPVNFAKLNDRGYKTDSLSGWMITAAEPILGNKLNWIIAGGESGPGARPAHPDWFRSVRDQCQAARVPFFFKQWGEWLPTEPFDKNKLYANKWFEWNGGVCSWKVGKKAAGRLLDGREWNEFPKVIK